MKKSELRQIIREEIINEGVDTKLFIEFADWLQYNGKHLTPTSQVKEFFKQR